MLIVLWLLLRGKGKKDFYLLLGGRRGGNLGAKIIRV